MKNLRFALLLPFVLMLQGCSEVLSGLRLGFAILMLVVIVGALFYAIYGNRGARRSDNNPRNPDAEDRK